MKPSAGFFFPASCAWSFGGATKSDSIAAIMGRAKVFKYRSLRQAMQGLHLVRKKMLDQDGTKFGTGLMGMQQRVAVVIAAWNAADCLPTSIAAAAAQAEIEVEILVADDASTDATPAVLAGLDRVTCLRLPRNGGPSAARNAGLAAARAPWIAVLDADDTMRPDRLRTMLTHAAAARADVVLGNFQRVDPAGRLLEGGPFLDPAQVDPGRALSLTDYVAGNLFAPREASLGYLKPLFRLDFLLAQGIRYDESLRNSEDYHIILACLAAGARVVIAPEPDYLYRVSRGSISHIVPPGMFDALLAADRAFFDKHAVQADARLAVLLQRRAANLSAMMQAEKVMFALKSGAVMEALRCAAGHPRAWRLLGSKLAQAAAKRLRR